MDATLPILAIDCDVFNSNRTANRSVPASAGRDCAPFLGLPAPSEALRAVQVDRVARDRRQPCGLLQRIDEPTNRPDGKGAERPYADLEHVEDTEVTRPSKLELGGQYVGIVRAVRSHMAEVLPTVRGESSRPVRTYPNPTVSSNAD